MITNMMITTLLGTPAGTSRKVDQSHRNLAVDTEAGDDAGALEQPAEMNKPG
jgi:hypothetical protein